MLRRSWWWNRGLLIHGATLLQYSWAEFESYYFDADMAAEIWEAAEVVAALEPISPRFEPGSIVRMGVELAAPCSTTNDRRSIICLTKMKK